MKVEAKTMGNPRLSSVATIGLVAVSIGCSLLSLALLDLRMSRSDTHELIFLRWNLILAWAPMFFALFALASHRARFPLPVTLTIGALWLLFLPNAPYLATDLIHVGNTWANVPLWFDIVMMCSFGATGLLLGYASIYMIQAIIAERLGAKVAWLATVTAVALSSAGIYLGRILRLNSWDAVQQPEVLLRIVLRRLADPFGNPELFPVLAFMFALMVAGYLVFFVSTIATSHLVDRRPLRR